MAEINENQPLNDTEKQQLKAWAEKNHKFFGGILAQILPDPRMAASAKENGDNFALLLRFLQTS